MTDTPRIKRFEEHVNIPAFGSEFSLGTIVRQIGAAHNDLAEHIERLERRINELTKTDQDRFVEDVKKTTEYLRDTIKPTKE